ncbi:hypothetical protein MTR_2g100925 [Medicago truncatula]|uniref:Uncharacterized protein n=1 Tax=Medicago truncatula TaxID=3880 RepID=A0A072VN30_MEDTR|nr:hypothetical protein MTR_2g100925 [Medicago truncatula]
MKLSGNEIRMKLNKEWQREWSSSFLSIAITETSVVGSYHRRKKCCTRDSLCILSFIPNSYAAMLK